MKLLDSPSSWSFIYGMENIIIFSDLDGTLLDHHSYSYHAAMPALELIAEKGIPLILTSSKSLAEIKEIQEGLNLQHPFIVENGGAICLPKGYFESPNDLPVVEDFLIKFLGPSYDEILQVLRKIQAEGDYSFRGFNDITVEEVMSLTGLSFEKAQKAKARLCSEPIVWEDTAGRLARFEAALKDHNFKLLKGGRFYHLMGDTDKGNAVRCLMALYGEKHPGDEFTTIGVGDSPNDIEMLREVDIPILVKRPDNTYIDIEIEKEIVYAAGVGPEGWNKAVLEILSGLAED